MRTIAWTGVRPPPAVSARLRAAGMSIERDAAEDLPLVVATAAAARVPAPHAERGRWLWISAVAVPPARATDAVLRGAYDVVALSDRDAATTIVTRLEEMLAAEP